MEISLQNVSDVQAKLTVKLVLADYEEKVNKSLKNFRQKANIPGFRPGMVPMGLVKKQYGTAIKVDEVNKVLQEALYNYIKENNIEGLGEPLPDEEQQKGINIATDEEMAFDFDLAIAPKFDATVTDKDTIPYYTIQVTDEMVDNQVKMYAQRNGHYDSVEEYQDNDMVKGILTELDADGSVKAEGISVEDAVMLPQYMKDEDSKHLFDGAKKDDVITELDGKKVKTFTDLQEILAQHRPGDKISVKYIRDKKEHSATMTLKNSQGTTKVTKNADMDVLGAAFRPLPDELKKQLGISYGLQVTGVTGGKMKEAGITKGFIILKVNGSPVKKTEELEEIMKQASQSPEQVLFLSGMYPSGKRANFAVDLAED